MKIPPCLPKYLHHTTSGNRNNNLFTAMKKIKQLNSVSNQHSLYDICLELNKNFKDTLNERELRAITRSIYRNEYKASCIPFNDYCMPCVYCKNNKPYNTINKNYFRHLTRNNEVKMLLPAVHMHPWDIMDTSKLSPENALMVRQSREDMGVNPYIDRVLKMKGLKIDDDALVEWWNHGK